MLERKYKLSDEPSNAYGLAQRIDPDWRNSKRRLLIILQTVDGLDLKNKELLSTESLKHAIKFARGEARKYDPDLPHFSLAVSNFNNYKHLHMKGPARSEAESEFRARILGIIKKLDPTHILISGDGSLVYPTIKHANYKNGWVHKIDGRKVVSTLDFSRLLEKQGAYANLLGFWARHFANLLLGRMPHDLSNVAPKPRYVNTMAKFYRCMEEWDKAKVIGTDTETKNLTVNHNAIYTIQFAFDHDPDHGYVIPIDHPHKTNPFTKEERKEIKRELRKRFGAFYTKEEKQIITFNGIYDVRVLRTCLELDIIYMPVWEIQAGEHLLDENIVAMNGLGIKSLNLRAVLCSYGNDFYFQDSGFTKEDRNTIASVPPGDKDFLRYGAMDVVSLVYMRLAEIDRAAKEIIDGRNYKPYFIQHMLHQMSDTVHQLSHLKEAGSYVNKKYLRSLLSTESPLRKAIKELNEEFKTFPEVRKANAELLAESGFKAKGLFGAKINQWMFSFTKPAHKLKLFIDILGLEPVNYTEKEQPAIDKDFVATYKDRNFIVAKFGEFQGATKLYGTYVKSWYKKITRELDGIFDNHLRASYKFLIDTGRLGSWDPNLQNIPARGKLSKIIKEMFWTMDGHLLVRFDYSAHEVRGWSWVSGDKLLAAAFAAGQKLRQQWIKVFPNTKEFKFPLSPEDKAKVEKELKKSTDKARIKLLKQALETSDIAERLKKEGDIHIQNVYRFFKKWVAKSDPLRDAVKKVIFGLLYGKAAETLGHDTKEAEINEVKAKMAVAYAAKDDKAMKKLEAEYKRLLDDDRTEYAQGIIDKVFSEFKMGARWVKKMQRLAEEEQYVFSPIGRIRHLYATMVKVKAITSKQVRRGMNAPIQGVASEISVKASRIVMVSYYQSQRFLRKQLEIAKEKSMRIRFNRIVHDASYFMVPFEMVIPFLHILQYDTTYGITKALAKEFNFNLTIEPEIEMEIGVKDTNSRKWDWSLPHLTSIIEESVDEGIKEGIFSETKEEIMEKIYAPWRDRKVREFLNEKYPLLGVDLNQEIKDVVNAIPR